MFLNKRHNMKPALSTLFLAACILQSASAQQLPYFPPGRPPGLGGPASGGGSEEERFNLSFPGGGPKELVAAIEQATGRPLNAIVATDYEGVRLPPMEVRGVTAASLFEALGAASQNSSAVATNGWVLINYGFATRNPGSGTNAVWYFYCSRQRENQPRRYCRFYQLGDFLKDYKVEDITTAIQTGWRLLGIKSPPELKFHPETKLLIAVGDGDDLDTIEAVLRQLRQSAKPPAKPGSP